MADVRELDPLNTASAYPFTDVDSGTATSCSSTLASGGAVMASVNKNIKGASNAEMREALFEHPITVAIVADVDCFMGYSSGIIAAEDCPTSMVSGDGSGCSLDHQLLAVGYGNWGTDSAYWILKNSWSSWWGEDGFVRVAVLDDDEMDSYACNGLLGINQDVAWPNKAFTV